MAAVTEAQAAEFLSKFDGPPPQKLVKFPPVGGDVLVRSMGLAGRLAQTVTRKQGADAGSVLLAACVFKLDHKTDQYVPFATAEQWERIGEKHYAETLALVAAVLDLSGDPRGEEKN